MLTAGLKNAEYWRRRFSLLEEAAHTEADRCIERMEEAYRSAALSVEKELLAWYGRFAQNNGLTLAEAKKRLAGRELEEFRWTAEQYGKAAQKADLSKEWQKKLENASARFHVSRLEAVELQIQQQLELLFGNQLDELDNLLRDVAANGYTRGAYEVQKGIGLGWDFTALDQKKLDTLLLKPWTTDGKTFRDRCWANKADLADGVQKELVQGLLRGDAPQKTAEAIRKRFHTSSYQARRLVYTETSWFNAISTSQMYAQRGVEEVEILETLDGRTCSVCGSMDGKVLPLSQMQPGVTVPPFHPNCRGTTCPHFEDATGERAARGAEGNLYYVPENMTYGEWKETFVDGGDRTKLSQAFQRMANYRKKDGSFDLEKAKEGFRKFLQSAPERNKMYLEQAMDSVGYESRQLSGGAFGYLEKTDTIYYDPGRDEFFDFDFAIINTHELSHRIDAQFIQSWEQKAFGEAIKDAKAIFDRNPKKYLEYCEQNDREGFLSDIFSAVCEGEIEFPMNHSREYWSVQGNREKEIFANLFSLESLSEKEKLTFLQKDFPKLWKTYCLLIEQL